jgi:hypothetical protein
MEPFFINTNIFICMRLTPILIQEGRKEDLRKKYTEKFKEYPETLDFILGISDLADTNFKYGDFVLKNTHPNSSPEEVEDIIELVKEFDRFQQSLDVKDINRYDLDGLKLAIESHKETSKSQLKKVDTSGTKKIFEDKNILIVRPLTYESSCKYGSGTRWCTTTAGNPSYFESHTSQEQALYYIILKNFNRDNKFYKIAVHITPSSEIWYDATDERMSDREKEVFNLGAPKVIETIKNDYSEYIKERGQSFFKKLFDFNNYKFEDVSSAFKGTKNKIGLEFQKPDIVPDMPGHATMELNISVDEENIDQYLVLITYDVGSKINFNIGYSGDNFEIEPEFDFGIENVSTRFQIPVGFLTNPSNENIKSFFNELCWRISGQVVYRMKNNSEFMSSIHGGNAVWIPNRSSYGYTFKRKDSGLIKKLVDYLDSNKKGTKLDFLVDIGSLEKKDINGKPFFSRKNANDWQIPSAYRGQYSGLFNSAKLAGILDYDKKGNQFYLKKGPNFEAFKSGQLNTL